MHSLNHAELASTVAGERAVPGQHVHRRPWPHRPRPPVRSRVAYQVARVASRLDREATRRAVA